ncbi:hypothetical protein JCM3765_001720 [Sporobolomyces pararoseus]
MIPYNHTFFYSPQDLEDDSASTSYFQTERNPTSTQSSAHSGSLDSSTPFGSIHQHIPFEPQIYSHSAPTTPYALQQPQNLNQNLLSPAAPVPPNSLYRHSYHNHGSTVYDQSSSLIRFDQAPVASSSSSRSTRREEAPNLARLSPPLPSVDHASSSTRQRESQDDGSEVESERKLRGKRGKRASSTIQPEPRPPTPSLTTPALPDLLESEQPNVEKADKSCKGCRGRKVRCSRDWPKCLRCIEKSIDCSYGDLVPVSFLKNHKLEERIRLLETELQSLRLSPATIFSTFLAKIANDTETSVAAGDSSKQGLDSRIENAIGATLEALWTTHGYQPALRSFLKRRSALVDSLDSLAPSDQVAIALCHFVNAQHSSTPDAVADTEGFTRVEEQERSTKVIEMYDKLEVGYEEASREGLEFHLMGAFFLSWAKSTRRRARGWTRIAISMFRDLLDLAHDIDAQTSPHISNEDLFVYFSIFPRPNPNSSLSSELAPSLSSHHLDHTRRLVNADDAIQTIYRWVVFSARLTAGHSSPRGHRQSICTSGLNYFFNQIAQIHSSIASLQNDLLRSNIAVGNDSTRLEHQLCFLARLNYQVDEAIYRSYDLVNQRLSKPRQVPSSHDLTADTLRSIEGQIMEGLKRAAFSFRLYSISSRSCDCLYLKKSLDSSLPTWKTIVVEQFLRPQSQSRNELGLDFRAHLSSTELDWIEHGLDRVSELEKKVEENVAEFRSLRQEREGNTERI